MTACYYENIQFSDPVFPDLKGLRAGGDVENVMLPSQGK